MTPVPVPADQVKAYGGLLKLCVRLLAREVDAVLYRQMLAADLRQRGDHAPLADPDLIQLGEDQALEELSVEYCRLFIGPEPDCPPYASAHHGGVKLGGRSAQGIDTILGAHGLDPVIHADEAVLDHDHIAVELSLLTHLYRVAIGATAADDDLAPAQAWRAAHDLLHTHIWPWADSYLANLEITAHLAPYTSIAYLTRRLLREAVTWPPEVLPVTAEETDPRRRRHDQPSPRAGQGAAHETT